MWRRFLNDNRFVSFKVKLVLYFLLLALLPLAALYWGFTGVASRSETRLVDARLHAGLRASIAAYRSELTGVSRTAAALARTRGFQVTLQLRDRGAIQRMLEDDPELRVVAPGGFRVGGVPPLAVHRVVRVVGPRGLVGEVIASVALNSQLAAKLTKQAGLEQKDQVAILQSGVVVGGPPGLLSSAAQWTERPQTVKLGGMRYRAVSSAALPDLPESALAVLAPQSAIDAANRNFERRYLLGLLVAIALLGAVAMLQGRVILTAVGRLVSAANAIARGSLSERVPVKGRDELATLGRAFNAMAEELETRLAELEAERGRLRDAFSRLGEALGATHDPDQLLRVIVETAVEATGAHGGILVSYSGEVVQIGNPAAGDETIEVPLVAAGTMSFGTLILYGTDFGEEQQMTAVSLAAQAVVALDNARLHRIVERQALVDGLTGLANRRQCEEALATELARAERLGGPIALVLADLDDFKSVNDRYGHPAGDAVLREFAEVLRENVREIDTAGRWGGEEFLVLLPGTDTAGAFRLAERLRAALEGRAILAPDGTGLRITASFGVAAQPPTIGASQLVKAADGALYEAKRSGKNRVESASEPSRRP